MADGGRTGVGELDPMEDLKHSVDKAMSGPEGNGQPTTEGNYLDSERNDPPGPPGDTD